MNAPINSELTDFISNLASNRSLPNIAVQGMINPIKKVDVLRYYRETKQAFLNLGSVMISQTDGRFYLFDHKGELVGMNLISC